MSSDLIARARAAVAARPDTQMLIAQRPPPRLPAPAGKVVFATDATGSRLSGWTAARALEDRFLKSLPEQFEIALAIYHNDLDTFTPFTANRRKLRAIAARIDCGGAQECLPEVLARVIKIGDVAAVINITDASADCRPEARDYANVMRALGTRLFILLDPSDGMARGYTPPIFADMAARTRGAVLPFKAASLPKLLRYLNGTTTGKLHHGK